MKIKRIKISGANASKDISKIIEDKLKEKEYSEALEDMMSSPKFDYSKFHKCLFNENQTKAYNKLEKEIKFLEWQIKGVEYSKDELIKKHGVPEDECHHNTEIKFLKALLKVAKIKIEFIEKWGIVR